MKPRKLPYNKFLESFKYAPRPAVNLLVVREDGAILLTKRKKPPFAGSWHLPGSFVLKGEALMDCVKRVAKKELGIKIEIEKENIQLVGAFNDIDGDPRGHVVDLVYRCTLQPTSTLQGSALSNKAEPLMRTVGDTVEMKFFKKLPVKIGFNHRETLRKLGYR